MVMSASEQAWKIENALMTLQLRINTFKHYDVNPHPLQSEQFNAKCEEIIAAKDAWFSSQTEENAAKVEELCDIAKLLLVVTLPTDDDRKS